MKILLSSGWRLLPILITPTLVACGDQGDADDAAVSFDDESAPVLREYADIVLESYDRAIETAEEMQGAVESFLDDPNGDNLEAARQAWLDSRPSYLQTEVYRFYGGPIDDDDGPEGQINAWPMDEAYIDYVDGDETAGIINDLDNYPDLDRDAIVAANFLDGETSVATGYHAIEFLLWGQDLSEDGPGERSFTDYTEAENAERRAEYLRAVTDLLLDDLKSVRDEWRSGDDNFRAELLALEGRDALGLVLTGMGSLSGAELSGERMQVAYETKSQEDEHSCFSDNTHVDHLNDQIGIQNIYLGRYGDRNGPSISDLVRARDEDLDAEMKDRLEAAKDAIEAIPRPFDQAILGTDDEDGRRKIKAAIDALKAQTATIAEIAELLDVPLNLE